MYNIGKRISVSEKENSLSIIINSQREKMKTNMLLTWIILWSLGGLVVLSQLLTELPKEQKIFLLIWLLFWLYFELVVSHAFLWRKNGFERILIKDQELSYKREIKGKGKNFLYAIESIKNLAIHNKDHENKILQTLKNSYWVIGGESLSFDYEGKQIKLGLQLDKNESSKLYQLLDKKLRSSKAKS